jgi:hypothetical protein
MAAVQALADLVGQLAERAEVAGAKERPAVGQVEALAREHLGADGLQRGVEQRLRGGGHGAPQSQAARGRLQPVPA